MKLERFFLLVCLLSGTSFFFGCSNRVEETRKAVEKTAEVINSDFENVRKAEETLIKKTEDVYTHLSQYDLSTKNMDVKDGGIFASFQDNKYYYKTVKEGTCLYLSPGKPIDDTLRREVRIMQHLEKFSEEAYQSSNVISTTFYGFHQPTTIAIFYPWVDVISMFPPAVNVQYFEFYNRGLKSVGRPTWSKLPFTDLGTGWVMDVAQAALLQGKPRGVAVISVSLAKVYSKFIKNQELNFMLLGPDTTLVGISPSAKGILALKVLEDFDYVKQMKTNTFVPDKFKLSDATQAPEIRSLAEQITKSSPEFEQKVGDKTYVFITADVKEVGFKVVGFTEK